MKKTCIILNIFLFLSYGAFAQYVTPGTGVHWSLHELAAQSNGALIHVEFNNFVMYEDITLSSPDTLSIAESALIEIQNGLLLTVKGVLLSNPVTGGYVTFTGNAAGKGNFKGIKFENSTGSQLVYNEILYGGGVSLVGSDVYFGFCTIGFNDQALCSGAITMSQCQPVIEGCTFYDNAGPAVMSPANGNAAPLILNNHLFNNVTANINMPQINLGTTGADTVVISGNTITGFYTMAGGMALSTLTGGEVKCSIENNTISNNRYGIAFIGSNITGVAKGNILFGNNIQNDPMQGGSGLNFYGGATNKVKVTDNDIFNNLWGITIQLNAAPNLGDADIFNYNPGGNSIWDNGNSGEIYDLYNNTPNPIKAENNNWGTHDVETVEAHIFHQPDNPSLGLVDYLPILDPASLQSLQPGENGPELWISPNPVKAGNLIQIVPANSSRTGSSYLCEITDIMGKIVWKACMASDMNEGFTVRADFPKGNYLIRIQDGTDIHSAKMVVY